MTRNFIEPGLATVTEASTLLGAIARPLRSDADLDPLMERVGDARFVLLGEASHGTHEFYAWRARISERLIQEKGFSFVAVEGDWPDVYRVDRYVKGREGAGKNAHEVLKRLARWPTWMWANHEVERFAERLHALASNAAEDDKVGFYGLDVYSLWSSMVAVVAFLEGVDPEAARVAGRAYECFAPYAEYERAYARATMLVPHDCRAEVARVLATLVDKAPRHVRDAGREAQFDAEQNARVAKNAEHYYRTMIGGGPASWNIRDAHMMETLDALADLHGPKAKVIVWAHNTHIGDARFTDMVDEGEYNLGQLVRERHGEDQSVLVGFGTHRGSVIAGRAWNARYERMRVPPAREGSLEDAIHRGWGKDGLFVLADAAKYDVLQEDRGQRAIGVVYRPEHERIGNYVPTNVARRYDVLLHIEETHALSPLHPEHPATLVPETYPSGM
jgi:erythromycin esterase